MSAVAAARAEQARALALLIEKNAAYGAQNIELTGMPGIAVRVLDKAMRLKSLILDDQGETPNTEGIEDTLRDLGNYALIGLLIQAGVWGPLTDDPEGTDVAEVSPGMALSSVLTVWIARQPSNHPHLEYAEGALDALAVVEGRTPKPQGIQLALLDLWCKQAGLR